MLSPRCSFTFTAPSYTKYKGIDGIDLAALKAWRRTVVPDLDKRETDVYAEPAKAPQGWWDRLGGIAERIWIVVGALEIFIDDIEVVMEEAGRSLRKKGERQKLTKLVAKGECHDLVLLQGVLGGKGQSAEVLES